MHTAEAAALGRDADQLAALVMPQIRARECFVVRYSMVNIFLRVDLLAQAEAG